MSEATKIIHAIAAGELHAACEVAATMEISRRTAFRDLANAPAM
jgi:hypothetical protein